MSLLSAIFLLVVGFAILVAGGEFLVRAAVSLAARLKVSPAVIGATIIAGGTSAPEMVTSALASAKGISDIAVGNVIGSNLFNILAILGLSCLLKPNIVDRHTLRFDYPILLFATVALLIAGWDGLFMRVEGGLFLLAMFSFLGFSFFAGAGHADEEDVETSKSVIKDILFLGLGFAGLIIGADIALKGGVGIGELVGLSERVIGITIISAGTGLPELVTSVVAAMRGRSDLAVANVVGSNILNTFGVIGVATLFKALPASQQIIHIDALVLFGVTLFLAIPLILSKKRMGRFWGALFASGYVGYLVYLVGFGS